jgi:tetratricopeptide (TPR) repeat protein
MPVPVRLSWPVPFRGRGPSAESSDEISLHNGASAHLLMTLWPAERVFAPGRYFLTVDLRKLFASTTTGETGPSWDGLSGPARAFPLEIHPLDTEENRQSYYALEGNYHLARGDNIRAAEYFESLIQLNPADIGGLGQLGKAYANEGRLRDAVTTWERVLPSLLKAAHSATFRDYVVSGLAKAYVDLGEEPNAIQTLARAGRSPEEIRDFIENARVR